MERGRFPIGGRVKRRRDELGISQGELAARSGYTQTNISDIEAGKVKRPGKLKELAAALQTTDDWLLHGQQNAVGIERPGIREIDVRAGLGGGGTIEGREVMRNGQYADPLKEETWRFPARFVREELRATEARLVIFETVGDSMAPTIMSGDRVIVDSQHRVPSPDGIYALRDGFGNIVVKRLHLLRKGAAPRLKIISDNSHHPIEEVGADEVAIVGRVLWVLKRL